ncbi:MAG: hypothetical protein COT37_02510 [Parcubacteria group bacterium CG08_land_8_20_14_0_20_43_9]|nr:MAG: hypothetical protein COT37_02510 [Parcubacteria group bacterium CG08_land_8_20_14_0_20_43_9]
MVLGKTPKEPLRGLICLGSRPTRATLGSPDYSIGRPDEYLGESLSVPRLSWPGTLGLFEDF